MKLSRIQSGLIAGLSVAVLAALAGCSSDAGATPSASGAAFKADADGGLTVMVAANPAYAPCIQQAATDFAKTAGGVKVDVQTEPFPTYQAKVQTAFTSGSEPWDAVVIPYQYAAQFKPFLYSLTGHVTDDFMSGINKSQTSLYTLDSQLYAVPFTGQADSLFYRKDLFDQAGLKPPTTWDEFNKTAKFFTNNPQFPGITGLVTKGAQPWDETLFNNIYLGLGGAALTGAAGTAMDTKIASQALSTLKEQLQYSQTGALAETQNDAGPLFATGVAAMAVLSPSVGLGAVNATTASNKVTGKVGVAAMPGGATEAGGWGITIPKDSTHPNTALKFIEFVKNDANDVSCMLQYGNGAVRDASFATDAVKNLWWGPGLYANVNASKVLMGAQSSNSGAIASAIGTGVAQYLAGSQSADEAAKSLANAYSSNLR